MATKLSGSGIATGVFAGTTVYVDLEGQEAPITVSIYPGSGCTCIAEVCNVPGSADTPPADASWEAWLPGSVTATKSDQLSARMAAVRFRRTAGSADCTYVVRGGEKA